jgi:putative membrane protein
VGSNPTLSAGFKNMTKKYTKRDHLAQSRTHLANERTLLAYWRTGLAFLVLGAFLIKFFPPVYLVIGGLVSIFAGIILFLYGIVRYLKWKKWIGGQ